MNPAKINTHTVYEFNTGDNMDNFRFVCKINQNEYHTSFNIKLLYRCGLNISVIMRLSGR